MLKRVKMISTNRDNYSNTPATPLRTDSSLLFVVDPSFPRVHFHLGGRVPATPQKPSQPSTFQQYHNQSAGDWKVVASKTAGGNGRTRGGQRPASSAFARSWIRRGTGAPLALSRNVLHRVLLPTRDINGFKKNKIKNRNQFHGTGTALEL